MKMKIQSTVLFCLLLILAACSKGQGISLHEFAHDKATLQNFTVCHGFGCNESTEAYLTQAQWQQVLTLFNPPAKNAAQERERIARAVGMVENFILANTDLQKDYGRAETFKGHNGQMDCVDEAINTSLILDFISREDVLVWNEVRGPIHRGYIVDMMWPHNSAAVREIATGETYAIDSYFFDTGHPASVVPLDIWLDNWGPDRNKEGTS